MPLLWDICVTLIQHNFMGSKSTAIMGENIFTCSHSSKKPDTSQTTDRSVVKPSHSLVTTGCRSLVSQIILTFLYYCSKVAKKKKNPETDSYNINVSRHLDKVTRSDFWGNRKHDMLHLHGCQCSKIAYEHWSLKLRIFRYRQTNQAWAMGIVKQTKILEEM